MSTVDGCARKLHLLLHIVQGTQMKKERDDHGNLLLSWDGLKRTKFIKATSNKENEGRSATSQRMH